LHSKLSTEGLIVLEYGTRLLSTSDTVHKGWPLSIESKTPPYTSSALIN
jgi:hypothetical protein